MKTIGRHLIAEFYRCDSTVLNDVESIRQTMLEAAQRIGATVMGDTFHRFTPQGVSGTVVISESHLSVHTWPEYRYVAVDIYTCGGLDPRPGFGQIRRDLSAEGWRVQEILRGLPADLDGNTMPLPDDIKIITRLVPERELTAV
ncbi:MAG: adenosylmethionine decarboxylase [Acidobacteriota bacterium]